MMTSLILSAALVLQAPAARTPAPSAPTPRPAPGPARVSIVGPTGEPGSFTIYADLDEARRAMGMLAQARRAGRGDLPEGTISIVHNTPVRVGRVEGVELEGRPVPMAEITIGAGPLKGRTFWISARRIRGFNEPDPATAGAVAAKAEPPAGGSSLAAKRKARRQAAYAAQLDREAKEAIAAAAAAKDYQKLYKEMLPYMLENQRQMLERMSAAERNAALQRMAGAMERTAGYVYPGQSPTQGPYPR